MKGLLRLYLKPKSFGHPRVFATIPVRRIFVSPDGYLYARVDTRHLPRPLPMAQRGPLKSIARRSRRFPDGWVLTPSGCEVLGLPVRFTAYFRSWGVV